MIQPGDTIIGYTPAQNNWLLIQLDKLNEVRSLDSICEAQLKAYKKAESESDSIEVSLKLKERNYSELLALKQHEVDQAKQAEKEALKSVKRQKIYKWLAIGSTVLIGSLAVYSHH